MKTAVYYSNDDIRIEEQEVPKISEDEILLRVRASGICGSDVMEWYRKKKAPIVLGHEVTGEVVEAGSEVKDYKKGDRVFVTHHVACNECGYCRQGKHTVCGTLRATKFYPGGFAEFLRVPAINVKFGTRKLPANVSYEDGSFTEPLGCVIRGQRIAGVSGGQNVLVIGSGISGILHIQLAKLKGANVAAADISQFRSGMAKKFGADEIFVNMREYTGKRFDTVIVCTGALQAVQQSLESADKGGTILFFAPTAPGEIVNVELSDIWKRCITLTTSYAAVNEDLEQALALIADKKINVRDMITHRLPLDETSRGFKLVAEGKESLKIIIEP